ncbi:LON peptidase substrate-binding domain-containing protein [Sphingobium phenoxybenzoativorans]|uniref:LON peptidase substrate-binding domain-containing protein n=1 Tax=Sphingobium phenoxybenzoativorans TaxID=1592790 RepID=A0A975Q188_9SPHN|nr:LON peptidase substrate-binding domain-containing protein [Sphingobium phenoxybenzoativorans]QUT05544.1 LON peptidase substrate-binding domain-containing protein [Sphingobium phenoxybenzoativorans]
MPNAQRISIFPLAGALLFPGMQLPLHIFEPRYRALVRDAVARDRRIGMIQPRDQLPVPSLYDVGCVGRIGEIEAMEDGRFNIVLTGIARFRVIRELVVSTPFRQVEGLIEQENDDEALAPIERAALEQESRRFADANGYSVDWAAVVRLDDASLVNGIAQVAPFDVAAKQALLEAPNLRERAERAIQLMQFFGRADDDGPSTLQ